MLFNSIDFAIFLPIVIIVYWTIANRNIAFRNAFLVLVSYLFYGWWDWRFLGLIAISSLVDFLVALQMENSAVRKKKALLTISIGTNLGLLAFFKYSNFFIESFQSAFTVFGNSLNLNSLQVILPVGISFYTFQTLSYTLDIYYQKIRPTKDPIAFFAFVSFFPQLVAGPIERASRLLPQFSTLKEVSPEGFSEGLKKVLWGFVLKIAIADRLALYVDSIYNHVAYHSTMSHAVATFFFSIQIYCDFAGYSLIAIGCARLMGFDLMQNFRRPYFSTSFKELWTRWHISLSSWFRDYVYIPMGGSRNGTYKLYRNLMITFLLSGLWHGASWTFVIWGGLHGLYLIIEKYLTPFNIKINNVIRIIGVYVLTLVGWVFFRANTLGDAWMILTGTTQSEGSGLHIGDIGIFSYSIFAIFLLFIVELFEEYHPQISLLNNSRFTIRFATILMLLIYVISLGVFDKSQFIYFQF